MYLRELIRPVLLAIAALSLLVVAHTRAQDTQPTDPSVHRPLEDAEAAYKLKERGRPEPVAENVVEDGKRAIAAATSDELRDLLTSSFPQTGLTLSLETASFQNSDEYASVALAIEIDGKTLPLAQTVGNGTTVNKLELSFFSIDENGTSGIGTRTEVDLATLKPDTYERLKKHGIRFNPRIVLAPGRYQLRVGARELAGGAVGSVFRDLIVPDFRNQPFALSGLLVTSSSAQQTPTAEPDLLVAKLLPGAATSRREFSSADTLAVYAELYANQPSQPAQKVDVTVRLTSESGKDVFVWNDELARGGGIRWNVGRSIPLTDLLAGRYLLRVEARSTGSDRNAIAREVPITVTTPATLPSTPKNDTTILVDRATRYVKEFVSRFSSVVADEVYLQQRVGPRVQGSRRREMISDFLFIRARSSEDWVVFRDVRLVDGREVRSGENRLLKLLTSPVADAQALDSALASENAQYSLQPWPIFNNPLIAVGILQDQYRERFDFSLDRSGSADETAVLRFRERSGPTILTVGGRNVFSGGRLWVDRRTGRIAQAELAIERHATVTTIFAHDKQLKIDVPVEMRERYDLDAYTYSTGLAKYSNFRTFEVQTDETLTGKGVP